MGYNGKQPILIYQKNAESSTNKMLIPKFVIDKFSRSFTMEIYDDGVMVLKPIIKKSGEK